MIKVKQTDYIVGLWMVERNRLGKAYVYAIKGPNDNEWTLYKKFLYENECYNTFGHDNDYKNIKVHKNIDEVGIIKLCNQHADDLAVLFNQTQMKMLIGGNSDKYNEIAKLNPWFPSLYLDINQKPEKKSKKKKK